MVFAADDAFPLTKHCMKPYGRKNLSDEERVFDYRCSRFRRISENGFGIWSNRFRLFATRASLTPEKAEVPLWQVLYYTTDCEQSLGKAIPQLVVSISKMKQEKSKMKDKQIYKLQHLVE